MITLTFISHCYWEGAISNPYPESSTTWPFDDATRIRFKLPEAFQVIYDLIGAAAQSWKSQTFLVKSCAIIKWCGKIFGGGFCEKKQQLTVTIYTLVI